jgi:hypothetical protein
MADTWGYDVGRQDAMMKQRVRGASDCVYPSLIFSAEKSGGPRRLTVLEHQELTERAIEMAIEVHWKPVRVFYFIGEWAAPRSAFC